MRSRSLPLLAVLSLLAPALASGLTPHLVKDINILPQSVGSEPWGYFTAGGVTFFAADDGDTGRELWRTDGTAGGTYRLADACSGPCSSNPTFFWYSDRSYFFRALDANGKLGLWASGGTPATTFQLTSASTPSPSSSQRAWVPGLGLLLFTADDGVHGPELWRSDGTPGGTYQVTDLLPGPQGSNPREMAVLKNRQSDGTPGRTFKLLDQAGGALVQAGNRLFFAAYGRDTGTELWALNAP